MRKYSCACTCVYTCRRGLAVALVIALMVATLAFLPSCSETAPTTKDNNCLTIVCTSFAAKEIAKALTQDWLTLETGHGYDSLQISILGQGGHDLHSYEPTAADLVSLYNADVFIYVGDSAEPWVASALSAVDAQSLVFSMMEACDSDLLPMNHDEEDCEDGHDHDSVSYDEHIWMSLRNMMTLTSALGEQLREFLPHAADLIQANEDAYVDELSSLDEAYAEMVAGAMRKEVLVADRNPFAYLMHDYGIKTHAAFPGCSSETEASFATQTNLLEIVKRKKLPYVLQTEGGESSIAKTLSQSTGTGVLVLNACQVMTDEERLNTAYIDIMRDNLETLRKALWDPDLPPVLN